MRAVTCFFLFVLGFGLTACSPVTDNAPDRRTVKSSIPQKTIRFSPDLQIGIVKEHDGIEHPAVGDVTVRGGVVLRLARGVRPRLETIEDPSNFIHVLEATDTLLKDSDVPYLLRMGNLLSLDLSGTDISDKGLSELKALPRLLCLQLRMTGVSGEGLAGLPALETLVMAGDEDVDDEKLATSIAQLPSLKTLLLEGQPAGPKICQAATHVKNLLTLALSCEEVEPTSLKGLGDCLKLEQLGLVDNRFHLQDIAGIEKLTLLNRLNLNRADDQDAVVIAKFSKMRTLLVNRTQMTAAGMKCIARLPNLVHLEIPYGSAPEAVIAVCGCTTLRTLGLCRCNLSPLAMQALTRLRHLAELDLSFSSLTDADVGTLVSCKTLESLNVENTAITGSGLMKLVGLPNLKSLCIKGVNASIIDVDKFRRLRPGCKLEI